MKKAAMVSALLIAILVLTAGLAPIMAERADRVLVEVAPGKMAMMAQSVRKAGGTVHFEFPKLNVLAVTLPASAVEGLRNNPNVVSIEEDAVRYPMGDGEGQVVPYGIDMVQAPQAWDAGADGEGVTVCIIDTGLYWEHEDIPDIPNVDGFSQIPGEDWFTDGYGHGTHVAGTITALDNEVGVIGVSPGKVNLFMVKIFNNAGEWVPQARASNLMAAAEICADNGAQIISMSLGGSSKALPEQRTFDALYEQGILSVASAGNDENDKYSYPASYDSVISVAAIDSSYTVASFSQFNDQVELAAPGVGVLSTVPFVSMSKLMVDDVEYEALHMEFAPYTLDGAVSGVLVDGGLCDSFSTEWADKVVLCQRGDISFADKVTNVAKGGGKAAVVYNNIAEGAVSGTLGDEGDWIHAIGITQADGQYLVEYKLGQVGIVEDYPPAPGSGYEAWNGTSMSAPHVSGVAALLWSANPALTNVQIREAMASTAMDLGDLGYDVHYGYGLVQAYDALDSLGLVPTKPGNGPKGPKGPNK